ncbi:Alpha/Beta hydrolase protein [Catenaria anguillulae PL171]|uniref:Alpha/Beta hydrolase protein n=1 Tax=Catenaria anguillulae PL171 TaxID=765915 RepID=A0A1Y2HYE3_9FUNG|nr:Alpha/Beta hydrolase protein [Catenaria anguillulae PL171]
MAEPTFVNMSVPFRDDPGHFVAVKVWGQLDTAVRTFVGCHGWLDNANTYDLVARDLLKQLPGSAFVSIDFSGHGRSSHAVGAHKYNGATGYLSDVLAVVDYFKIESFIAIGHSMGGGVLTAFCGIFPERVSKFICIENIGQPDHPPDRIPSMMREYFDRLRRRQQKTSVKPMYPTIDLAVRARANAALAIPESAAHLLVERGLEPIFNPVSARSSTRGGRVPVLYVIGEQGYFDLDAPAAKRRLAAVRKKRVVVVPGGHHPHLEPEAAPKVVNAIVEFVREPMVAKL